MNENGGKRHAAPLVHGRMVYRCEACGESWFMYLEKGIEEFGENHKPSPFMMVCPHCGGWASDVSGIQKVPSGGYVPLPSGCRYVANLEDRDCGVPMLYEVGAARSGAKILIVDELDQHNRCQQGGQTEDEEVLEDIQARVKKYIENFISAGLLELGEETKKFSEAATIFAEQTTYSLEEVMGALMNALNGSGNPKKLRRAFFGLTTAWERKEAREKRRAVERENASRFRQHKTRETAWSAQKRIGPRRREWRGPWRETKRTK